MKLQLTKTAKQELKEINIKLEESDYEYYDNMSKRELLIQDAMLYTGNAYVKNKFTKLDEWCISNNGEYDEKYLTKYPNAVKQKIGKMIMENIITIVE